MVRDATGLALPGATVAIAPGSRALTTAAAGIACADGLAQGTYAVTARLAAFQPVSATLTIPAGQAVELTLRPTHEEHVIVTRTRAERDLRTAPLSIAVVERRQLDASGADSPPSCCATFPASS